MTNFEYLNSTKNTITNYVVFTLTPHIYEGFNIIYNCSNTLYEEYEKKREKVKTLKEMNLQTIFMECLKGVLKFTAEQKEKEYNKIKNEFTKTHGPYFDSLILSCLKMNYACLTYDNQTKTYKDLNTDNIKVSQFIFNCYIENEQYFFKNPELFLKKNKKNEIFETIKQCIFNAIIKSISTRELYEEFLKKQVIPAPNFENLNNPIEEIEKQKQKQKFRNVFMSPVKEDDENNNDNDNDNAMTLEHEKNPENPENPVYKLNSDEYIHEDDFIKQSKKNKSIVGGHDFNDKPVLEHGEDKKKSITFEPNMDIKKSIMYDASEAEEYFNEL